MGTGRDGLEISAESLAMGTPNRWLNPVGVADLNGDRRVEIAAVIMPHMGGVLRACQRHAKGLVGAAVLTGFSNHGYCTPVQGLSRPVMFIPQDAHCGQKYAASVKNRIFPHRIGHKPKH